MLESEVMWVNSKKNSLSPHMTDYFVVLGAVVIWGGSFAATKSALAEAEPMLVILLRLVLGMPVLLAGVLFEGSLRLPSRREFCPLFLMGFQGIFFHQAIQSYAMKTAGAANANWQMVAAPAFVAILGRIFLGEKIPRTGAAGLALSAIGVATVLGFGTIRDSDGASFGSVGDLIIFLSVINWAVFLVLSRRILRSDLPSGLVIFWEMLFALLVCLPFAFFIGCDFSSILSFSWETWAALVFLGAFSSALAYLFWFHGLAVFPVAKVVVFQFLQPLAGALVAYTLVGERFTPWLFVGGALTMCGVWLVNRR